jgi:hypothetical protein
MQKNNKTIMFAIVVVILIAAPVSFYELVIGYSNPPVSVVQNGYEYSNSIYLNGTCCSNPGRNWNNITVSTLFHQSHTVNSILNMSLINCVVDGKKDFNILTLLIINGTLQPGLHPLASILTVNYSLLHAPYICIQEPLKVAMGCPPNPVNVSVSDHNYCSQTNSNLNPFTYSYYKANYTSSCKMGFVNVPSFSKGTFHFSLKVGYEENIWNLTKGKWIYTQIAFSLLGFSKDISVVAGFYLVGDTD